MATEKEKDRSRQSYDQIIKEIKSRRNPENIAGMARFGINPGNTYGVPIPVLRKMAKDIGNDHELALKLWSSGIHEARILASMVDDPELVTDKQIATWVGQFDSWDVCDQCCMNLLDKTEHAFKKAKEFAASDKEFVKRAGFALMACLAVHDKGASDERFEELLPMIVKGSTDERNFVKKAVNWALRQIGKRSAGLNKVAIETAKRIQRQDSKAAKWVANDALKELTGEAVQKKLREKRRAG
jgi:3-methyladenine DNA glycosylase AlkD